MNEPKYRRVLLKISGEALAGDAHRGLNFDVIGSVCDVVKQCVEAGVQVGIVVGGGNFWRGIKDGGDRMERTRADQMGMLATVINSLALQTALEGEGAKAKVLTSIRMEPIGELYSKAKALELMAGGCVVIIAGGTGNPYFTTDTASALRGVEIEAEVLLKGTRVDGVYTADPEKDPTATKFEKITYDEIYNKGLKVMDLTATTMCKENHLPIVVFNMDVEGNLKKLMEGQQIGTIVY